MVRRKYSPFNGKQYLRNNNPGHKEVHDLDNEQNSCKINEISMSHIEMFDSLSSALYSPEYDGCKHCLPTFHKKIE